MAGGDGSVAAVAGVAVERELALVVVPTGTLNHFARDLGLDLARPLRALDALYAGHERRVDVGRINGRPFINNVSLGVYAQMVGDPGYRQDKLRVAQDETPGRLLRPRAPTSAAYHATRRSAARGRPRRRRLEQPLRVRTLG